MGAFDELATGLLDDALGRILGKEPVFAPWESVWLEYKVLKDFTYTHSDQDVNHGVYSFKTGELVRLLPESSRFLTDRANLSFQRILKVTKL